MTDTKTGGNQVASAGSDMSDAEVLRYTAAQVEDLTELVRDRLDALGKQLDHVDEIAHEVDRRIAEIHDTLEKYRPLLERYADPGKAVRDMFSRSKTRSKDAVPEG